MSSTRRRVYLTWFVLHFTAVGLVCLNEGVWLQTNQPSVVTGPCKFCWDAVRQVSATFLLPAQSWPKPLRCVVATYLNAAGIEAGYGYFAPNVPETYALIFECRYRDGRVDYITPLVWSKEAQLRLTNLIEQIGRTDSARSREELITLLARSTWQRRRDAVALRAFLGSIAPPSVAEFQAGKRERIFSCLYVYDFTLDHSNAAPLTR